MRIKLLLIIVTLVFCYTLFADVISYDKALRNLKGVKAYEKDDYADSEENFKRNSIKYPKDARLHYNQANAQVKNGMLEEAEQNYQLALNNDQFKDRSKALQNLGNVKFMQKDYKNAIKNFRDALVDDPANLDARYNYELAARMLQRQQEQKQQQEQNQDDSEKNDEEKDKQNQQQQQQDKQDDGQKEKQQKQDEQKQDEKQKSQEQKMKEQKKEDAEKMLKALLQKEKEEMKKEKEKIEVDRSKTGKYW